MRSLRALLGLLSVLSAAAAWVACSSSSSGGKAAGGSDASADVSSNADTGTTTDAGADTTPAPACTPQPVGTPPTWVPSTDYPMNACTSAALAALMTDCLTTTFDAAKCAADKTTYPACSACVFTPLTAPALGPLVEINDLVALNYGGCLGLAGNAVTSACAPALGLENECAWQSCAACTHPLSEGGVVEIRRSRVPGVRRGGTRGRRPVPRRLQRSEHLLHHPGAARGGRVPGVDDHAGGPHRAPDAVRRILLRRSGRRRRGGRVRRVTS
jgi:hypothetical protein